MHNIHVTPHGKVFEIIETCFYCYPLLHVLADCVLFKSKYLHIVA